MKKYSYTIQKGGQLKTTEAYFNSVAGKRSGKRCLAVDNDWQPNLTYALGYHPESLHHTLFTLMAGRSTLEETLLPTYYDPKTGIFFDPADRETMDLLGLHSLEEAGRGPDLLPNNTTGFERVQQDLQDHPTWGLLLRQILEELADRYDECHIDTNPDIFHRFTKMASYAADSIVFPMVPENWPLQGIIVLSQQIMQARAINPTLSLAGIVFTRVNRYSSYQEIIERTRTKIVPAINQMFEAERMKGPRERRRLKDLSLSCFDHMIPERADFGKDANKRANLLLAHDEISPFALEYWEYYIELMERTNGPGYGQVIAHYNRLVERYTHVEDDRQRREAAKRRKKAIARTVDGKAGR